MKNYEEKSDPEINKLVTEQVAWTEPGCTAVTFENNCFWANATGFYAYPIKDYCNDVSVAWPIIVESGICINFRNEKTSLVGLYEECPDECDRGGELRSAMICFLEMKDAEEPE